MLPFLPEGAYLPVPWIAGTTGTDALAVERLLDVMYDG
jgi:hypothetical protein